MLKRGRGLKRGPAEAVRGPGRSSVPELAEVGRERSEAAPRGCQAGGCGALSSSYGVESWDQLSSSWLVATSCEGGGDAR